MGCRCRSRRPPSARDVAREQRILVALRNSKAVAAAVHHQIAADDRARGAKRGVPDPEPDAVMADADDHVAGDHVAASLLDADPLAALVDAVAGDHVPAAGTDLDAATPSRVLRFPRTWLRSASGDPEVAVSHEHVALDEVLARVLDVDAELAVAAERVVDDPKVMRAEHAQSVPVGKGLSFPELSRITVRADPAITKPKYWFLDEARLSSRLSRAPATTTPPEPAHRSVSDGDAVVAVVGDPDVAYLPARAALDRLAVAGDRVTVQVERDVVGADHDAVARAVREVAVERRVRRDRVAAVDTGGGACPAADAAPDAARVAITESNLRAPFRVLSWVGSVIEATGVGAATETRLATVFATWSHGSLWR